jgi:hypothetical protein
MTFPRSAPLLLLLAVAGCSPRAGSDAAPAAGGDKAPAAKGDPWPAAAAELRKATDVGTCRRVIGQLNGDLADNPAADAPPALAPDAAAALGQLLRLAPDELAEATNKAYTPLDAAYLADAFYLRDAVRSLDLGGLPPERQAAAIFDWVGRMAHRRGWTLGQSDRAVQVAPCVPPTYVLRRGYGTGLERATVFLAALQQAGIDGALIGPPGQEQGSSSPVADGKETKGPFWAVAARGGADLFLFDPWRGEALPGPGGKPATLAQVRANPALLDPWFNDKARPWDVPREQLAAAVPYVAVPLSAATPRMRLFDSKVAAEVGVKLALDPKGLAEAVGKAAGGPPAAIWAPPPADGYAYTRVLRSFLPADDGGADRTPPGPARLYDRLTVLDAVPVALFAPPAELAGPGREAIQPLFGDFLNEFKTGFVDPGLAEKVHRGQFNEVVAAAVQLEGRFAASQQRSRTDPGHAARVRDWCRAANEVYAALSEARLPENRDRRPAAEAAVGAFWRASAEGRQAVLDQAVAAAGMGEAAYLLAVCKHEQAERAEGRRAKAADGPARERAADRAKAAWAGAKDAWDRYAPHRDAQDRAFPGRGPHAKALADRAAALAGS